MRCRLHDLGSCTGAQGCKAHGIHNTGTDHLKLLAPLYHRVWGYLQSLTPPSQLVPIPCTDVLSIPHMAIFFGKVFEPDRGQQACSLHRFCTDVAGMVSLSLLQLLQPALQSLKHEDAENIGYVIPTPVIDHFISDYARNGHYTAFPALGIEWQKMESPFMRKALGMKVKHGTVSCTLAMCRRNGVFGHVM